MIYNIVYFINVFKLDLCTNFFKNIILMKYSKYLITSAFTLFFLTACSSDDGDTTTPDSPKTPIETPTSENTGTTGATGSTGMTETPTSTNSTIIEQNVTTATLSTGWKKSDKLAGFTGDGYIVWEGAPQFWKGAEQIGKTGLLTFPIKIQTPGTYQIQLKTYIAKKDPDKPNTEHNDTWVRLPDADDFFAKRGTSIVYPKGSGKTPNPEGENGNGFFKAYMNINDEWTYTTGTFDNNFHEIFATFDKAGDYSFEIAPRSDFHAINSFRLILQKP